jgi:TIR domain
MEPAPAFKYDLFISHSSKDKEFVRDLVDRFERVGIRCWLDEEAIDAGGSIVAGVFEGIKQSRKVLLVYSPEFFSSVWAKKEYQGRLMSDPVNQSRKLLPIMLKQTEVAEELQELKWLDATSPVALEKAIRKVLEALLDNAPVERAYISYTHDGPEHKSWVASLHRKLRQDGVEVRFDYDFMQPGRNVWKDIERYIDLSTCALMIGTPEYLRKATNDVSGLFREYKLLLAKSARDPNFRLIPILRDGTWSGSLPADVQDNFGIDMRPDAADQAYPGLLRTLLAPGGSAEIAAQVAEPRVY